MNFLNNIRWGLFNVLFSIQTRLFNFLTGPHYLTKRDICIYLFAVIDTLILVVLIALLVKWLR
jgi:hypothetical protein